MELKKHEGIPESLMQVAMVTGSESGLGSAIADVLFLAGYNVYHFDAKLGDDVREPELSAPVGSILNIDVLVNCAGVNGIDWLEDVTPNDWHRIMDTNVYGMFAMTKHFLPQLAVASGTVLNIISNASHMPMRCSAAYNASKGAAHILTLQLARELYDRHGITVFGISPNRLAGTEMSAKIDEDVTRVRGWALDEAQKYQNAALPTHEETDPTVLAEFIGFLLSKKRNHQYLHGCILPYGA